MVSEINRKDVYAAGRKEVIDRSDWCVCFYCFSRFYIDEIVEWCDDDNTAICPCCGIDTVIGSEVAGKMSTRTLKELHTDGFGKESMDEQFEEGQMNWFSKKR